MPLKRLTLEELLEQFKKVHGDRYDYSKVEYIDYNTKVIIVCKKHGEWLANTGDHKTGHGCPRCKAENTRKLESHDLNKTLELFKNKHGNIYDYSKVEYKNNKTKVEIICRKHGSFWQTPGGHKWGFGCPKCKNEINGKKKSLTKEKFISGANKKHNNFYDYSIINYNNSNSILEILCPKHGIFKQKAIIHYHGSGCQKCNQSKGERKLVEIFENNNIIYEEQKVFNDCKGEKRNLKFDFYLPIYHICIEFDGEQHFKLVYPWQTLEKLERIKLYDSIKNQYCKEKNIRLMRFTKNDVDELEEKIKQDIFQYKKMIEKLNRNYEDDFKITNEYLEGLPDLQNSSYSGPGVGIEKVGISNFRLPLKIKIKNGGVQEVECSIVGTVSLEGIKKGINMSRIIRTFYEFKDEIFDINKLEEVLKSYQVKLGAFNAHILLSFNYRMWQDSLRSVNKEGNKNGGWQYYKVTFETNIDEKGVFNKYIHFDFVYSSACPCSTELSLHAMDTRGQYAIPHSQRSIARISIKFEEIIWLEELHELCKKALKTETLVFCKREDEQAFAELNAANVKFVEDAVRLLYQELNKENKILDFKVIASHNESLHSHDAIAVVVKGIKDGFTDNVSIAEFKSLIY